MKKEKFTLQADTFITHKKIGDCNNKDVRKRFDFSKHEVHHPIAFAKR